MPKERSTFALGLTVIIMALLFFGIVLKIGTRGLGQAEPFVVRFEHSQQLPLLKVGAPVICGVEHVGQIDRIDLAEVPVKGKDRTELMVEVFCHVQKRVGLRRDATIVAEGPVLGAAGNIVIVDRGNSAESASPDVPLVGKARGFGPTLAMLSSEFDAANEQSLLAKIHESIDDLNQITTNVSRELDAQRQAVLMAKLHEVADHINDATRFIRDEFEPGRDGKIMAKIHTGVDSLNDTLAAAEGMLTDMREPLQDTIENVREVSHTLDTGITKPLARQLDVEEADSLLAKIHASFDRVNASLADLNVVTDASREVLALNKDKLSLLITNVKETTDHLRAASKDLRRNPWKLLYTPRPEEVREFNVHDAARDFSEAATRLDDSMLMLRALVEARGGAIPADDPQLQEIRSSLEEAFNKFSRAEEALWKKLQVP